MKLYDIINAIPVRDTVTVVNYMTDEILVDCETVSNLLYSTRFHLELKDLRVYTLQVGKVYGDIIIAVDKD